MPGRESASERDRRGFDALPCHVPDTRSIDGTAEINPLWRFVGGGADEPINYDTPYPNNRKCQQVPN